MASIEAYHIKDVFRKRSKERINETSFGGGYKQYILDGLNTRDVEWDITFVPLDENNANTLEGILLDCFDSTSNLIEWIGPGESTSSNYTAHNVEKSPLGSFLFVINCTLRKEYIIG
jgi:phage-related protein